MLSATSSGASKALLGGYMVLSSVVERVGRVVSSIFVFVGAGRLSARSASTKLVERACPVPWASLASSLLSVPFYLWEELIGPIQGHLMFR